MRKLIKASEWKTKFFESRYPDMRTIKNWHKYGKIDGKIDHSGHLWIYADQLPFASTEISKKVTELLKVG